MRVASNEIGLFSLSLPEALALCANTFDQERRSPMFLILAVVLVVLWLGGFTLFHVTGFLIHLLLIFAVISIVMHFITGRRAA